MGGGIKVSDIKKVDFYCGAFLSYLITNKIAPTLFEAGENYKTVKFETNCGNYKVYIKYSRSCKGFKNGTRKWDIYFTDNEMSYIEKFEEMENNKKLLFALVCTDPKMRENEIAVVDYKDGLRCLGNDPINETRRITIIHKKSSPYMTCYGTAIDEVDGLQIYRDCDKYFLRRAE